MEGATETPSTGDCVAKRSRPVLTKREIEVVLAWVMADTKSDVGKRLFISMGTVNTHVLRVRDKYRVAGRAASTKAALLVRFLQDGYVTLDDLERV